MIIIVVIIIPFIMILIIIIIIIVIMIIIIVTIIMMIIIRIISSMVSEGFGASAWDEGSGLKFGVAALEFVRVWVSGLSGSGLCSALSLGV